MEGASAVIVNWRVQVFVSLSTNKGKKGVVCLEVCRIGMLPRHEVTVLDSSARWRINLDLTQGFVLWVSCLDSLHSCQKIAL